MSSINLHTDEISIKVVYYGPGLGGKTTSLQYMHRALKPDSRGQLISLATGIDRTLYFDFLPVKLPKIRGFTVRMSLYTVPGQVHYNATRKLVLQGADGVVFVADSQPARHDANMES
ncbi:MAG: gliding motility protein, partial [Deltaproteobacteria bacterium]|nr:gliding motility protein [Deltaproteobacteria bacterium]